MARRHPRNTGGACLVSAVLHALVLGSFVSVAGLEPASTALEIFAVDLTPHPPASISAASPPKTSRHHTRPVRAARAAMAANRPSDRNPRRLSTATAARMASSGRAHDVENGSGNNSPVPTAPVSVPPVAAPALPLTPAQQLTDFTPPPHDVIATTLPMPDDVALLQPDGPSITAAQEPPTPPVGRAEAVMPPPSRGVDPVPSPSVAQKAPPRPSPAPRPAPAPPKPSPAPAPTGLAQASPSDLRDALAESPAASSAFGLGLGRLRIQIDGARVRTTARDVEVISGTLIGGDVQALTVSVGDTTTVPTLDGRSFSAPVALKAGLNQVRIVGVDARGGEVEEIVAVEYNTPTGLTITSPPDGHRLRPEDPPLVVVEGVADDPGVSSVWLVSGQRRISVPVVAGRFRHVVPVLEPRVVVRLETPAAEGRAPASSAVTVHAAASRSLAVLLRWPDGTTVPATVTATWRARADRLDNPPARVALESAGGHTSPDLFFLRDPKPGVYTISLAYGPGASEHVLPALYLPGGARKTLEAVALHGSGGVVLARVLMPHGVLWEEDDWFTGRSASGDAVTKFRFPDGISWTERMGRQPR